MSVSVFAQKDETSVSLNLDYGIPTPIKKIVPNFNYFLEKDFFG
ncbi:hypothetical protein EZS27_028461 [termite gut metagenome]|uniref:Uncharacterized protein n=1 Tax=termite gut metagenome TaxID=433724 RepID=A0A5J4QLX7_9ZZZZ